MPIGKLVFAQLMDFLPLHTFRRCVARYPSNYPTKTFSHLDQYLSMAFAQLTFRESLRDIEVCLRAHEAKLYHLGIRGHVARSNLGDANEKRDWRIYRDFANSLIAQARRLYADDAFAVDLDNTVYALDTTTIDLSLKVFPWAHFRKAKAAVKMHTQIVLIRRFAFPRKVGEKYRTVTAGTEFRPWSRFPGFCPVAPLSTRASSAPASGGLRLRQRVHHSVHADCHQDVRL